MKIKESLVNDNYNWKEIASIASEYYDIGCTDDEIKADLQDCGDNGYINKLIKYVNTIREVMDNEDRLMSYEIAKYYLKDYMESDIWDMFYNKLSDSRIEGIIECIGELNENVKMRNRTIKTRITESDENNVTKNNLIALCEKYGYYCNPGITAYKNADGDISWARISLNLRPLNHRDYHPDIYVNDFDNDTEIMNTQIGDITVDKIYIKIQTTSYGSIPTDEYISEFLPAVNDAATLASELENFDYSGLPVLIRD